MRTALFALSLTIIGTAYSSADSVSLTVPETTGSTPSFGSTTRTEALTKFGNYADGGYMFNNGGTVSAGATEGIIKTENGVTSLNLCPRAGAGGSGEAIVLSGATDLSNYTVDAFTLDIAESSSSAITGSVTVTLAVIQKTNSTWSVLQSNSGTLDIGSGMSLALNLDNGIDWSDTYKVVAVIDNTAKTLSGNNASLYTLSGISITASATAAVPEPATASLSLLALGALALRRRRK